MSDKKTDAKAKDVKEDVKDAPKESPDTLPPDPRHKTPVDRHAIREVRSYVDDKGRKVQEFVAVFGKSRDPNFYKGQAVIQVQRTHPQGISIPPQMRPFEFDIEATGLRKAFELFDDAAEAELAEMRKRHKEQSREQSRIVGPGGKPI